MKNGWVISLVVVLLLAVTIASATAALADLGDGTSSGISKLSSKVAAILGLDEKEVDDAIKQAQRELKHEAIQSKLNAMVEKGQLTQEQADQKLDSIRSDQVAASKKGYGGLFEMHAKKAKGSFDGDMEGYLSALVEKGQITQEQADEKLRAHQEKASKANSS